jgi:hypothetical protein
MEDVRNHIAAPIRRGATAGRALLTLPQSSHAFTSRGVPKTGASVRMPGFQGESAFHHKRTMRAETATLVDEIKQAISLLRRHL